MLREFQRVGRAGHLEEIHRGSRRGRASAGSLGYVFGRLGTQTNIETMEGLFSPLSKPIFAIGGVICWIKFFNM